MSKSIALLRAVFVTVLLAISTSGTVSGTQLAASRSKKGLLIGANVWEGVANTDTTICKIRTAGNFVALEIGTDAFFMGPGFLDDPVAHRWLIGHRAEITATGVKVGSINAAIRSSLKRNKSYEYNKEAIVDAAEAAIRTQMEAKDLFRYKDRPAVQPFVIGIVLGMVSRKNVVVHLIRIDITNWEKRQFHVYEPAVFADQVGESLAWFHETPEIFLDKRVEPTADTIKSEMTSIYESRVPPSFKKWVQPPFVIGEMQADGMHWATNASYCSAI